MQLSLEVHEETNGNDRDNAWLVADIVMGEVRERVPSRIPVTASPDVRESWLIWCRQRLQSIGEKLIAAGYAE